MAFAVLGIDTSGSLCSAALARGTDRDGEVVASRRRDVGNAHASHVLPMVRDVLLASRLRLEDCDAIAYTNGPGSFTGLRIGCSVAQGLAFGAGCRIAEIDTLGALARAVAADDGARLLVAQDARMGEVYWAMFQRHGDDWRPRSDARLTPVGELGAACAVVAAVPVDIGAGNAWAVHGASLDGLARRIVPLAGVDAIDVALLGLAACATQRLVAADATALRYVRDRVALTTREREEGTSGETAMDSRAREVIGP